MKTNKFLSLALSLFAAITIVSCVEDDDFSVPNSFGNEENMALNLLLANATEVDMTYVKALYNSDPNGDNDYSDAIPFKVENDIYVKGYVSSSDQTGNFFKEFFIQDSPENPTQALKVILEKVDSYNQFNKGREVYINLKGLFIGEERTGNGIITIGGDTEFDQYGGTVTRVNQNQIEMSLLRSQTTEEIIPLNVTFSQITDQHVGLFVQVNDVEFAADLNGERYFDAIQVFDTQRTMQVCDGFNLSTFPLETSSFASFKEVLLPTGNGTIKAVVNKTFDGSTHVLAINQLEDVNMEGERCTLLDINDFSVVFEENFESMSTNTTVSGNGWTAYAEAGAYNWRVLTTSDNGNPGPGNQIASMGAYNSGVVSNIAWLVSPVINLDTQDAEFINFQSSNSFSDDSELELLISTDWDGTQAGIATAIWSPLQGNIVSDNQHYQDWVDSGMINLSSYSGNAYIAFKYIGGDNSGSNPPNTSTTDGTYEIDNFKVLTQN